MTRLYTLGHSDRTLEAFLVLLQSAGIEILVDVRAKPASRRFPHFDEKRLRSALDEAAIQYHWAGRQLGGMRRSRPDSSHTALPQAGLRGYADYMETDEFQIAARQLIGLGDRAPTAIMCAERLPQHCHRSLMADYLIMRGAHVVHLIVPGETIDHCLSPSARRESAQLIYDRHVQESLDL
jgi:uncharacterized protein (DUF488 family)